MYIWGEATSVNIIMILAPIFELAKKHLSHTVPLQTSRVNGEKNKQKRSSIIEGRHPP